MAERKVSKRALTKAYGLWVEYANAGYSWVRLMGHSYAMMLVPVLHDLYPDDKEARNAVVARSTQFFNTEPNFGSVIHGIAISMEERIANGDESINGDDILMMRTALMGPLAGIGDTLLNMLNTIFVAIFTDITVNSNAILGPILYIVFRWASIVGICRIAFFYGYKKGGEAISDIIDSGKFDQLVTAANIVGCVVMGAMMCQYVNVTCGISYTSSTGAGFSLQSDLFDALLPKLLPLGLTMGCWALITKKKVSMTKLLLILIAIAIVGGYTGILV